jgi:hypothetical protein
VKLDFSIFALATFIAIISNNVKACEDDFAPTIYNCDLENGSSFCDVDEVIETNKIEILINLDKILKISPQKPIIIEHNTPQNAPSTVKDISTIIIACFAVLGFLLQTYIFFKNRKDRIRDKEGESFTFWLKDIIFPNYINPLLEEISDLEKSYYQYMDDGIHTQFLQTWEANKSKLKKSTQIGSKLPYFASLFRYANESVITLEDEIVMHFFSSDLVAVDDLVVDYIKEITENPFTILHQSILQMTFEQQNKMLN